VTFVRLALGQRLLKPPTWMCTWLASEDFFDLLVRAVLDSGMRGTYYLTSPNPARNAELMEVCRDAVDGALVCPRSVAGWRDTSFRRPTLARPWLRPSQVQLE
jgi:NAD dependent epimerase/dehydratase family enzyme